MRKIYIIFILLLSLIWSCTDNFEDYNTDKKNPAQVAGESLFSNAEKSLSDQVNSTNVNQNVWKLWAQYWTETTYTDEANYDIISRNIPDNIFRYYYREPLMDLKEAAKLISEQVIDPKVQDYDILVAEKNNKLQIIEILNVYAFQQLVDIFGMVPYSEALDIENVYPAYEDGLSIYTDLLERLDAALNAFDVSIPSSYGSADLIYGGDVTSWIKFGNTLKIRLGIALSDVAPELAKSAIESAAAKCFTGIDDNALFPYMSSSPNQNPLYVDMVASGRDDFVPANTIVDIMNDLSDPRREKYFTQIDTSGEGDYVYMGGDYGYSSSFLSYSHVNPAITEPTFSGFYLTYSEVMFYLAEAAERGFTVPETAEEYYNMGIESSILEWGGTSVEATTYLAQAKVAYSTATGDWKQKIATQSWIASYTRGLEGYNTWRRLDYPAFNIPEAYEGGSLSDIPVRFTFPVNEQTLNGDNYDAAAKAIGGDELSTKVFWDIH